MMRLHSRLILVVAAICLGMVMNGCESPYERAMRLSCSWNHDIALNGCDRWDFAECINDCEWCVGAPGTPFAGKSDECNQLKCGAHCANVESDPKCLSTYKVLCEQGKEAYFKHHQKSCDVDCNTAPRAQPHFMAIATIVFFAFSKLPTRTLLAVFIIGIALHIQGCQADKKFQNREASSMISISGSSSEGVNCAPNTPLLPDWKPDLARLDLKAGCKNVWNWWSGNPCASDVPVILAKKGLYEGQDGEHIIKEVENERYNCTKRVKGYCAEWTVFEKSCKEEDFGVCSCSMPSANEQYCAAWRCITKEAEQNMCWRSCCGDEDCTPCVLCGAYGSAPFPMNRAVFDELMASEGILTNVTEGDAGRRLGHNGKKWLYLTSGSFELLGSLRESYWEIFNSYGECIASRDIHNPDEIQCSTWREIETELQTCKCLRPDPTESFCMEWKCEEKDVGQFSILFTVDQNYENLISGQEVEKYECTQHQVTSTGTSKCTGWRGEIESWEEVEVTQCRGCQDMSTPHCQSWYCDEYEAPRILPEETVWPRRIGMAAVNFAWMLTLALGFWAFCAIPAFESMGDHYNIVGGCIASACITSFLALLMYAVAFLRWHGAEQYWWTPPLPLAAIFLTFCLGCVGYNCVGCVIGEDVESHSFVLAGCWVFALMALGLVWVGGFAVLLPFIGLCLCLACLGACSLITKQASHHMDRDLMSEEAEEEDNEF